MSHRLVCSVVSVKLCEAEGVEADFYIKTFHHHKYPTGPKPEEIGDQGSVQRVPRLLVRKPAGNHQVMSKVAKPWIAFKIMAAGAIPPKDTFNYAFTNGADHILVGMFDFEIAQDVETGNKAIAVAKQRTGRPWRN